MNDDEITLKENEDRRRIMREQSDQISKLGARGRILEGRNDRHEEQYRALSGDRDRWQTTAETFKAENVKLKKLLFQRRKIHEWSTTLLELDLAEIQAAWCDFDAVVADLKSQ